MSPVRRHRPRHQPPRHRAARAGPPPPAELAIVPATTVPDRCATRGPVAPTRSWRGRASVPGRDRGWCRCSRGRAPPPTGRLRATRPSTDRRRRRRRCRPFRAVRARLAGRPGGRPAASSSLGSGPSARRRSLWLPRWRRRRQRTEQPFDHRRADRSCGGRRSHGRSGCREPVRHRSARRRRPTMSRLDGGGSHRWRRSRAPRVAPADGRAGLPAGRPLPRPRGRVQGPGR